MRIQISLSFKQGTYAEIEKFGQQVILKTDGVKRYSDLQPQVTIVKSLFNTMVDAVAAASNGGKLLTKAKQEARKAFILGMEDLVDLVKVYAKGDETYVTGAGFDLIKKSTRSNAPFDRPKWNSIKRGVLSGTIEGEVKNFPKGVKELGIKHSYDGWMTENNGTYSTGKKFTLTGLDIKREVEIKVCFHGTYQRTSNDSVAMPIFVL